VANETASEGRWYNALDDSELAEFFAVVRSPTTVFRGASDVAPNFMYLVMRAHLATAVDAHGGDYLRGTWVRLESTPSEHVVVKVRQPDGSDATFELTPDEMQRLLR
jgi:hypothetical protein